MLGESDVAVGERKSFSLNRLYLNEYFMMATCALAALTGLGALYFLYATGDALGSFVFGMKLVTVVAMYGTFKSFRWDVSRGLMGGVLFSLMFQEAYLMLGDLWRDEVFNEYFAVGPQGGTYLSAAGMTLLMTIVMALNHFIIDYSAQGNAKNVMINRIAIGFKFAVYVLLIAANSQLALTSAIVWHNALQNMSDALSLVLLLCVEAQLDDFKETRYEMREAWQEKRADA